MPLDDDDDFDLFAPTRESTPLSSLLDDLRTTAPAPTPDDHARPTAPAPAHRPSRDSTPFTTTSASLAAAERKVALPSSFPPPPDEDSLYGLPGGQPWEQMAYAYRVLSGRTRALERAALLARDMPDVDRAMDEALSALGRELHDDADARGLVLPVDATSEVLAAKQSLAELGSARSQMQRNAERHGMMTAARRESAAASLDPLQSEQDRKASVLDASEREVTRLKHELSVIEARWSGESTTAGGETSVTAATVESARRALALAERANRDAALAYAEVRRRAVLQIGRIAEVDKLVEGAKLEDRKAARDLARKEDATLEALRKAYAKLGTVAFEQQLADDLPAFVGVRRARDRRMVLAERVETLRRTAATFDPDAYRKGQTAWLALGVAALGLLALFALVA